MLSETEPPTLTEQAINELQSLTFNLYTPISREQWERNTAIYEKLLSEVFGISDWFLNVDNYATIYYLVALYGLLLSWLAYR